MRLSVHSYWKGRFTLCKSSGVGLGAGEYKGKSFFTQITGKVIFPILKCSMRKIDSCGIDWIVILSI